MSLLMLANIVLVLLATIGMHCIAHKRKIGFIIFFGVELCLAYIGYTQAQYGLIVVSIIYFLNNIYAYYRWSVDK